MLLLFLFAASNAKQSLVLVYPSGRNAIKLYCILACIVQLNPQCSIYFTVIMVTVIMIRNVITAT